MSVSPNSMTNSDTGSVTPSVTHSVSTSVSISVTPNISTDVTPSNTPTASPSHVSRIIQLSPSPLPSVFSQLTNQEWNFIIVVPGFVTLCIFASLLNQHFRLNKLEKLVKNTNYHSTTNPIGTTIPVLSSNV
jgi:hypothetical protein